MTKAEYIERYGIEWYEQHNIRNRACCKERYQNDPEFRKSRNAYQKERYHNDSEYREYKRTYMKTLNQNDLNSNGKTKNSIRCQSSKILFKKRHHSRLKGYEIHHCFGYDDATKFIYIPKSLHTKIHQYLRDNSIDADSDHYKYIVHMLNECTEYTYISA